MTLQSSGSMTGADIRGELRQTGGNLVFPDATTRWLADKPSGSLVLPTDYYSKTAVKLVHSADILSGGQSSWSFLAQFGPTFPTRLMIILLGLYTPVNVGIAVTGFTIGGFSPTGVDNRFANDALGGVYAACGYLINTVNSTGTVSLTFNTNITEGYFRMYSVANASIVTANGSGGGGLSALNYNVNINSNAYLFSIGMKSGGTDIVYLGGTERENAQLSGSRLVVGWNNRLVTQASRPLSMTAGGPASAFVGSSLSFGD